MDNRLCDGEGGQSVTADKRWGAYAVIHRALAVITALHPGHKRHIHPVCRHSLYVLAVFCHSGRHEWATLFADRHH